MVRDACLLSQALKDNSRAVKLQHWHKELENLVTHLKLRTNSQREAAETQLRNIHNTKAEMEGMLAALESRASQLTHFLEVESQTHRAIDSEALRSLDEAINRPAPAFALPAIALNQAWSWIGKVWS
jgi:predicted nuclease with TOPRIM domain